VLGLALPGSTPAVEVTVAEWLALQHIDLKAKHMPVSFSQSVPDVFNFEGLHVCCIACVFCPADLFAQRPTVSLQELHNSYMQTYNEQKERQQQLGQAAQQQDAQQPHLRPITPVQLQMAIAQLTDMVTMRGGILSRKQQPGPAGAAGAAAAAEINA
jgi:hypothetical protein